MTSRSGDCAALVGDGLQLQPKYLDTLDFSYNGSMGMLAHIPKIDDDIVMSRQGFSAIVDDPAFVPSPSLELVLFSPPSCPSLMAVPGVSLRFPRGSFITMPPFLSHTPHCLLFLFKSALLLHTLYPTFHFLLLVWYIALALRSQAVPLPVLSR